MNKKQVKAIVEKSRKELTQKREELTGMERMAEIIRNQIAFDEHILGEMESMLR